MKRLKITRHHTTLHQKFEVALLMVTRKTPESVKNILDYYKGKGIICREEHRLLLALDEDVAHQKILILDAIESLLASSNINQPQYDKARKKYFKGIKK